MKQKTNYSNERYSDINFLRRSNGKENTKLDSTKNDSVKADSETRSFKIDLNKMRKQYALGISKKKDTHSKLQLGTGIIEGDFETFNNTPQNINYVSKRNIQSL